MITVGRADAPPRPEARRMITGDSLACQPVIMPLAGSDAAALARPAVIMPTVGADAGPANTSARCRSSA